MGGDLTAKSPARLLIAKKFSTGEITGKEYSKDVSESEEDFNEE